MKDKTLDNFAIIMIILVVIYFFILNMLTSYASDDFAFKFIYGQTKRISCLADLLLSIKSFFFGWSGRIVPNGTAMLLLMSDNKTTFNLINTIFYLLFLLLLYGIGTKPYNHKNIDPFAFLILIFICWKGIPSMGETVLWLDGACNYLWASLPVLLMLYLYKHCQEQDKKCTITKCLFLFLLGIIAGNSNESFSACAFLLVGIHTLYALRKGQLRPWMVTGLCGMGIGLTLILASPGNAIRLSRYAILSAPILSNQPYMFQEILYIPY